MSVLNYLKANKKVKGEHKTTIKKDMTIEQMRGKIDTLIAQSYSYIGRTAFYPVISVEDINTISDLILAIEHNMNKTLLPLSLRTNSELCSAIQFGRYNFDNETYVSLLKAYINYLIENNIPNN